MQLFDVRRDPWERRDLANDPKHAATLAMLDSKLRELMREFKDPLPAQQLFAAVAQATRLFRPATGRTE